MQWMPRCLIFKNKRGSHQLITYCQWHCIATKSPEWEKWIHSHPIPIYLSSKKNKQTSPTPRGKQEVDVGPSLASKSTPSISTKKQHNPAKANQQSHTLSLTTKATQDSLFLLSSLLMECTITLQQSITMKFNSIHHGQFPPWAIFFYLMLIKNYPHKK